MNGFIYVIIMLLAGGVAVLLFLNSRDRLFVYLALRQQLRRLQLELNRYKHNPAKQFELLDPVYQRVVFQLYPKLKMERSKLEELVSDELNRLIKSKRSSLWASIAVAGRGLLAGLMLSLSTVSGYVAYTKIDVTNWFEPKHVVSETNILRGETFELPDQIGSPKELGMALAYHMSQFDESFAIRYIGDSKNFEQTMEQAGNWLEANHIYVYRLSRQWETQVTNYGGYVDVELDITYDMTTEQANQIQARVDQVVAEMPVGLNDFEKVKYINDYVVLNTAYNLESQASPYTPYSILFNGEGVCEGYALTTLLLLEAAGVEARYISGEAGTALHAWNLVKLDGSWYHLDTTWNDPVPNRPGEVRYDYFLVSDATLQKDHTWEIGDYPLTAMVDFQ